jgi:Zn-dependent metalloprotease
LSTGGYQVKAHHPAVCFIVPPHVLKHLSTSTDVAVRERAQHALEIAAAARGRREAIGPLAGLLAVSPGVKRRTVYDARHGTKLPGKLIRGEGAKPSSDKDVNQAYDFAGNTYDFYNQVFQRNSVDNHGMRLDSTVHYNQSFNNAFWDGTQMVYGDGDGVIFVHFTTCIDVIGHELTHGVTQFTSKLEYEGQSGALNEHFSDVMGSLVKQWTLKQTAAQADWLIGKGLLGPGIKGIALRSMKAPGTAYSDPKTLGRDPQPGHMKDYVNTNQDNGGVHINSGVPNKAFFNVASALGGNAWEKAGKIWYSAFTNKLGPAAQFADAANATYETAGELYGVGNAEQIAVGEGWKNVGVNVAKQIIAGSAMITIKAAPLPSQPPAASDAAYAPLLVKPRKAKR